MQVISQEKSPIKQKILLYLAQRGVSPYEFYKKSGVTRGILQQCNGISEDNIARFLAYAPDINITWLMTGEGEMLLPAPGSSPVPSESTTVALPASLSCKTAEERISELERQNAVLTRSLDLLTRQLEALLERQQDG